MRLIDLHVHSNASDGSLSPREVAFYAKAKGLSAIALTDHDTTQGISECLLAGQKVDLEVIPGIELTASYCGKEIHILGYFINYEHDGLQNTLKTLRHHRDQRNQKMLQKFQELGFDIREKDLYPINNPHTILTRAHFARALINKGHVSSMDEAFNLYLSSGKPAYFPKESLDYKACIHLIHEAGGIAIVAHPLLYGFDEEELEKFILYLSKSHLDGIETYYAKYTPSQVQKLLALCKLYDLIPTGGSDFHGSNKPGLEIGSGYDGTLQVPYSLLEKLKRHESS